MDNQIKKIYLIRHFTTANNKNGVIMGKGIDAEIIDPPPRLVESYKKVFLKVNKEDVAIYSSPRTRCKQTAEIIGNQVLGKNTYTINNNLDEINYGDFEGKTYEQLKKLYPKKFNELVYTPSIIHFPSGDKMKNRIDSAYANLIKLMKSSQKDNLIIVTHVDIIKGIIFKIIEGNFDNKKYIKIDNGSITKIDTALQKPRICYVNYKPNF